MPTERLVDTEDVVFAGVSLVFDNYVQSKSCVEVWVRWGTNTHLDLGRMV